MRRALLWFLAPVLLLSWRPAQAHPHVFIDWRALPQVEQGAIVAVKLYWQFDDLYSDLVLESVDRDKNRKLSPSEIEAIAKRTLANLEKGKFYSHFMLDGKTWQPDKAAEFSAEVDGDRIVYIFKIALPRPAKELSVSAYDPEYYIEMLADKRQPTTGAGFSCKAAPATPVKTDSWGSITPDIVSCLAR